MRPTPFAFVFGDIAPARFPAIAEALEHEGATATDRDRFVLLEPVGRLLRELLPEDAGGDALEAHVVLLHHAYLFWAAGQPVYTISDQVLHRAVAEQRVTTHLPRSTLYLQLPELRVWGSPNEDSPAEPLDGMFASEAATSAVSVLAIFGMRPDRPGFSAVGIEGRADAIVATRDDGSVGGAFDPMLAGGTAAGLYSVANAGELLLLTTRLLALLDSAAPR